MTTLKACALALNVTIAAMLGACASGGGGGSSTPMTPVSPPPPATPPPPPVGGLPPLPPAAPSGSYPSNTSAEYNTNWGPEGINADAAWQYENAHGEGILIGVVDDGIIIDHPELAGRIDTVNSIDINTARNQLVSDNTHGAELSSLIAGNFNGASTVGVAYESTILAVRADNGADGFTSDDIAAAIDYAVDKGVKVINLSLGSDGQSPPDLVQSIQRATAAGVIIVVSAGNSGPNAANPNYPAFLATDPAVSNGLILIAGGNNPDGTFNTRSNRAGQAADYYLTAPGWEIVVPDYGPPGPLDGFQRCYPDPSQNPCTSGLVEIQGTSYASPHVTAAIAVLMSAFPGLTPEQVVAIIRETTDDQGDVGVDSLTGHGSLNLERAFQPIGTVAAPLSAGYGSLTATSQLGLVGAAFGDGFTDDAGEWAIAGFDSYGRTYQLDVGAGWLRAHTGPALAASAPTLWRNARTQAGLAVQFAPAETAAPDSMRLQLERADIEQPSMRLDALIAPGVTLTYAANNAGTRMIETASASGHAAFAQADQSIKLTQTIGSRFLFSASSQTGETRVGLQAVRSERSATTFEAGMLFHAGALNLSYGAVTESQGALGLAWSDDFGATPASETRFVALGGHFNVRGGWKIAYQGETGILETGAGWLSFAQAPRTTAFALEAQRAVAPPDADHESFLRFSLSQPLRVESGALLFMAPNATNYGRQSLTYEERLIDVAPSGRELRVALGYHHVQSGALIAFSEAAYILDPGHRAGADPALALQFGLRARY